MNERAKTTRPFKERVIEGLDRSRLRQEVLKAKRKRFGALRRRYGTMVLGASLAVGGIGIPMGAQRAADAPRESQRGSTADFGADLATARDIAREVAGGVDEALFSPGKSIEESFAPKESLDVITEQAREEFFRTEVPFGSLIYKEAKKNDLAPELVAAVVQTESRFKPTARSGAGAQGLMQLMPRTGRWMGAKNLMNPTESVRAGTKYLKYLNERFDGDQKKVLAAYNAGEGNVRRYGGIPPFRETRNYVVKVDKAQKEFEEKVTGLVAEKLETATGAATSVAAAAR